MARALRILFAGAYYHVLNRGQGKRTVFYDNADYQLFKQIVGEACQTSGVRVVAYCLMNNHYHLLVQTPHANLSTYMRQVNGVYTQRFNKRYREDGSLFKGRYKAVVVQEGSYLLRLIKYIHENPLRAGIVSDARDYAYSSHKAYVTGQETEWLRFHDALRTQWKKKNLRNAYREYMSLDDEKLKDYLSEKRAKGVNAIICGDDNYVDAIKIMYLNKKRCYGEIPEGKKAQDEMMIRTIKKEITSQCKVAEEDLIRPSRGKENIARMLAIGLVRECTAYAYRAIGQMFGNISYKSAAKSYERLKKRCKEDRALDKLFRKIKSRCS